MYSRAVYSFLFVVLHKHHSQMAHKWNTTYRRSLSELYALSSCSRWQWDHLVNIVDDFISPFVQFTSSQPSYSSVSFLRSNYCPQFLLELSPFHNYHLLLLLSTIPHSLINHSPFFLLLPVQIIPPLK